jgi:hypothetical protein
MDFGSLAGAGLTLAGMLLGGVVWLVRLEGRINVLNTQQTANEKRVDGLEARIFERLDRMESKIDALVTHR